LANDLNTLPLALSLAPRLGVHADLHEFAPAEKHHDLRWRIFVAPFQRWLCRRFLPEASSATTVSRGIAARYERDFGVTVGVVTNAAPFEDREPSPVAPAIKVIHSAAGQRARRIEVLIDAMRSAPEHVSLDLILMP